MSEEISIENLKALDNILNTLCGHDLTEEEKKSLKQVMNRAAENNIKRLRENIQELASSLKEVESMLTVFNSYFK
jgi:RNA processing factor Prp31